MCTTLVKVGMAWQQAGVDPCVHGVLVAWAMLELQEVVAGGCRGWSACDGGVLCRVVFVMVKRPRAVYSQLSSFLGRNLRREFEPRP